MLESRLCSFLNIHSVLLSQIPTGSILGHCESLANRHPEARLSHLQCPLWVLVPDHTPFSLPCLLPDNGLGCETVSILTKV